MPFRDRDEAGDRLAEALVGYSDAHPVVLALPRGGLPVARPIAQALGAPLDIIVVRKIGVPGQPELAMGAVVDGPEPLVVRNEDVIALAGVGEATFAKVRDAEVAEIARRRSAYLGERAHPQLAGKTAIVVDDGIATGATTRAALRAVRRQKPARLVLAVPVAASDSLAELRGEADAVICLEDHPSFGSISMYYEVFDQVSDRAVKDILAAFPP